MNSGWTKAFLDEVHRVWPVFRCLSGSIDAEGNYREDYIGARGTLQKTEALN